MIAIKKEPGKRPVVVEIEDDLKALQEAVGGWIETVTLPYGLCVICNEEGRIMGLPFNTIFAGIPLVGTFLVVGTKGEDFADVPEKYVPKVLQLLHAL